jgi:hypothetical protein
VLIGIRVAAPTSLLIKHVNLAGKSVTQNPREVASKFGKQIETCFTKGFPEAEVALAEWLNHLDNIALYSPDDRLFPA